MKKVNKYIIVFFLKHSISSVSPEGLNFNFFTKSPIENWNVLIQETRNYFLPSFCHTKSIGISFDKNL